MRGRQPQAGRRKGQVFICWSLFAAGLLVYLSAPHLKISNRAFVIPQQALSVAGKTLTPEDIIRKQRLMQFLSAVLTASGALGLAFHYRDVLFRRAPRDVAEPPGDPDFRRSDGQRQRTSTTEESSQNKKEVST